MVFLRAAVHAALFTLFLPLVAAADDVTLTSRDHTIELSGDLLGYDGEFYRIETEYGVLTVDGSGVTCDGPGCPELGAYVAQLTFSGAVEMADILLPALIEGFALRRGYRIERAEIGSGLLYTLFEGGKDGAKAAELTILRSSSGEGFADLLGERADFALSLREVRPEEVALAKQAGLGNLASARQARVIALDAMVPVVARSNPLGKISLADLRAIFAGQISNWAQIGGEDAPVTAYLTQNDVGFSDQFLTTMMRGTSLGASVVRVPTNHVLTDSVARDPFGIGIASFAQPGTAAPLTLTGSCGFQVAADKQAIKAEDYPLTAPLYLYLPARRLPKIGREFLTYLRTGVAQMVVRRTALVDQMPGESPVEAQGRRLANAILAAGKEVALQDLQEMVTLMAEQARLSVTFRFRDGSSDLDAQSLSNVSLLAHALEAGRYDGRVLRFVGFSDGQGDAGANKRLALRRARAVLKAVREAAETLGDGQVEMRAVAFGEALPMACDDTPWGRQVNRRVEVWLR